MMHNKFGYFVSRIQILGPFDVKIGEPIKQTTLDQLRAWLRQNYPETGARLPPERALSDTLNISRSNLRKSLAMLEAEGRIMRHVGRGTFVKNDPAFAHTPASLTALTERTGPHDAMTARIALEPELAHMAALQATPLQISRIQDLADDVRAAKTWDEYEQRDHAFHDLIAESAGNVLLYELHKIMNAVRQVVVWRQLSPGLAGPPPNYRSFTEHAAIVTAISKRDRMAARTAMRAHLKSTFDAMTSEE